MNWYKKAQNKINVTGEPMVLVFSEIIDTILYELYNGEQNAAIRTFDTEAQEVIHIIKYRDQEKALQIYRNTIEKA